MPNWKDPSDYDFTDKLKRARWVWEFMRRNLKYRAAYDSFRLADNGIQQKGIQQKSHLFRGEDIEKIFDADGLGEDLGAKWGQRGTIADPANDQVPPFFIVFPVEPDGEEVESFYYEPEEVPKLVQIPEFVTLTFAAEWPIHPQLKRAKAILKGRQHQVEERHGINKGRVQWPIYLRLLDALEAGATTQDIIETIEEYKKYKGATDGRYIASDRISDHKKSAEKLRANPLHLMR